LPRFDVVHLGIGADAHTASLFPGEPLIEDRDHIAAAVHVEKLGMWRMTLLPGVLIRANHIATLVSGDDKAPALRSIFQGDYAPRDYPAQIVAHHAPSARWFLDAASARLLD
jgi:6-phosphogluconolactonase